MNDMQQGLGPDDPLSIWIGVVAAFSVKPTLDAAGIEDAIERAVKRNVPLEACGGGVNAVGMLAELEAADADLPQPERRRIAREQARRKT